LGRDIRKSLPNASFGDFSSREEKLPAGGIPTQKLAGCILKKKSPKSKQKKKILLQTQKQFDILDPSKQEQKTP